MKYYAVIDTNVIVSAQLKEASVPGQILKEALNGRIIPLLHPEILGEYEEVLSRKKFKFDPDAVKVLIDRIKARGIPLDAAQITDQVSDPKDVIFYQVVMEGREKYGDAYLVTGNIEDFPMKVYVVTPREMLEIMENNEDPFYPDGNAD